LENSSPRKPNRLAKEKSPYLLQHAYNFVDWFPWGDEALRKAKAESKPIFLSIGYSACHWCHVFAHESFEDESTAAILNKDFVSIKVDREERPELDDFYMAAVQAMTGQGGWPLSVFLTPDLKPFYGGTYFPPKPLSGMPSFKQVLELVISAWKDRRGEVTQSATEIMEGVEESFRKTAMSPVPASALEECYAALVSSFDPEYGGYGGAPKFPQPLFVGFLLRYHHRTGKELAMRTVRKTLEEIGKGGIRDHLGGGFHRYSTDRMWTVPHFEKMLYDNALLAVAYLETYQATRDQSMVPPAVDALTWMTEEMRSPEGAFYSAQDADTTEGEGAFYTWTQDEVSAVLGPQDAEMFSYLFGVTRTGSFEGTRSVLRMAHSVEEGALRFTLPQDELTSKVDRWRSEMYRARLKRPRPVIDTKVLNSWNGLAISAFAKGWRVLGREEYLRTAVATADFVLGHMVKEGDLLRIYAGGEAALPGTVEDYAFLVQGLIDLFEADGRAKWLEEALRTHQRMIEVFWDKEAGGLFLTAVREAPARIKTGHDGPTPSGSSVAALNAVRLGDLTGKEEIKEKASEILRVYHQEIVQVPSGYTEMLCALDLLANGTREVVITARDRVAAGKMVDELNRRFAPDIALVVTTGENYDSLKGITSLLEGRAPGETPTAYICENHVCRRPMTSIEEFSTEIDKNAKRDIT